MQFSRRSGVLALLLTINLVAVPIALTSAAAAAGDAVLVVASPGSLTPGEIVLQSELTEQGYAVTLTGATAPASTGAALVVISPAASGDPSGLTYRNSSSPVVMLSSAGWRELALTTAAGSQYNTTNLLVVDTQHPVASGLPSPFAPANGATLLQSALEQYMPSGADPVAARSSTTAAHVVYTISAGQPRSDGSASPANRVALGLTEETLNDLSEAGLRLLDNAFYWADHSLALPLPAEPAITQSSSNAATAGTLDTTHSATWGKRSDGTSFSYVGPGAQTVTPTSVQSASTSGVCTLYVRNIWLNGHGSFEGETLTVCSGFYGAVWTRMRVQRTSWSGWRSYSNWGYSATYTDSYKALWWFTPCNWGQGTYTYRYLGQGYSSQLGFSPQGVSSSTERQPCGPQR